MCQSIFLRVYDNCRIKGIFNVSKNAFDDIFVRKYAGIRQTSTTFLL